MKLHYPHDMIVTNHHTPKIEPLGLKPVQVPLWFVYNTLKLSGFNLWPASGTFLALYRDGRPITHDTDIDFELLDPGDDIYNKLTSLLPYRVMRTITYKSRYMQIAFWDPTLNLVIDIYLYYTQGTEIVNWNEGGEAYFSFDMFANKRIVTFRNKQYVFPDPNIYLTTKFGTTWSIPETSETKKNWIDSAKNLRRWKP